MDFKNFDVKELPLIINAIGVLVMFLWGFIGNAWDKSWIAVCVSGVLSGLCYSMLGKGEKKE